MDPRQRFSSVRDKVLRGQVTEEAEFRVFLAETGPRLRRALSSLYGPERGREATAEALAYAWEHWHKVRQLSNPTRYLFRVGQSKTRTRKVRSIFERPEDHDPWHEPALAGLLAELPDRQRMAVVLIHGFGWTLHEVADLAGIKVTSVQNHLERALSKLRSGLEVTDRG
jgi:DNA-directed RNA polymerase specialized sigma24 family protein